jgi:hypothetical protein
MAKLCAYCGGPPPLTREHIWPAGFLRRQDFGIKFSARAGKTFAGDLVIGDVCETCNNGPLSVLDSHACELYDRRFGKRIEAGSVVTFTYDYGLLMRWLLKISYNSARSTGRDAELLSSYRDTIRSPSPCTPVFATAFVATISPSDMMDPDTGEIRRIYPLAARCGPLLLPGLEIGDFGVLRCVMINAFQFTIVVTRETRVDPRRISRLRSRLPGQPLAPSGRMRVGPPTIPARVALRGIEAWPPLPKGR